MKTTQNFYKTTVQVLFLTYVKEHWGRGVIEEKLCKDSIFYPDNSVMHVVDILHLLFLFNLF